MQRTQLYRIRPRGLRSPPVVSYSFEFALGLRCLPTPRRCLVRPHTRQNQTYGKGQRSSPTPARLARDRRCHRVRGTTARRRRVTHFHARCWREVRFEYDHRRKTRTIKPCETPGQKSALALTPAPRRLCSEDVQSNSTKFDMCLSHLPRDSARPPRACTSRRVRLARGRAHHSSTDAAQSTRCARTTTTTTERIRSFTSLPRRCGESSLSVAR